MTIVPFYAGQSDDLVGITGHGAFLYPGKIVIAKEVAPLSSHLFLPSQAGWV